MKVCIYARCSTNSQDTERQIKELESFCKRMKWKVLKVFTETISGAKKNTDRPVLMELMDFIQANDVQRVCVWELSRLGRSTLEVLKSIEELHSNCIGLYVHNYSLQTMNDKCEVNPMAKMIVTLLAEFASMEREQIKQRMMSGLKNYFANGGKNGRVKGQVIKDKDRLLSEHKDVARLLKKGLSVRNVMSVTNKSSRTVQKIKKLI
jgi:DNA invertase Pin-like site-specific DNA recombinase